MNAGFIKEKVGTVLYMVAVTFVTILLVAFVHLASRPAVERNQSLFLKKAVRAAAGLAPAGTTADLMDWFEARVSVVTNRPGESYYRVRGDDGADRAVLVQKGPGLWGTITAYVGFNPEASAIAGVTFEDHVETPGLGARIDEPWFRSQFTGKSGPFRTLAPEPKDKSRVNADPYAFDQITGATITSTAVKEIINKSIERTRTLTATTR